LSLLQFDSRALGEKISRNDAKEVNAHLSDEHDKLLGVLLAIAHASVLLQSVRNADRESNNKYDQENEQADLQIASDLAPHGQNHPYDDRNEQNAHAHVRDVLPLGPVAEHAHRISDYIIEKERAHQRAVIDGQEYLQT
jgi:hypothetical protein